MPIDVVVATASATEAMDFLKFIGHFPDRRLPDWKAWLVRAAASNFVARMMQSSEGPSPR
jgi:hypothetical protein